MHPSHVKIRARRHHHKSLDGCRNCRRKHLKCDEVKPACTRCILTASDCEYGASRAWVFPAAGSPQANSVSALQPSATFSDASERRAFTWFTEKTLPDVTGFTSQTSTFWRSVMPRLSDSEPAIRHILIAVASKHEALAKLSPGAAELTPLCAKHHSLALQHLVQPDHHIGAEILLISCIAFSFFERMRDPFAMQGRCCDFVLAGLKILRERRTSSETQSGSKASSIIDDFLAPMFFQMELVLGMFCNPDKLIYFDANQRQATLPQLPVAFADLRTARHSFFHIIARRYRAVRRNEEWSTTSAAFRQIRTLLERWLLAFDAYLSVLCPDNKIDYERAFYLREQVCLLIGALLYSVRSPVPVGCYCRPIIADLSNPLQIFITIQIHGPTKVNLSGVNTGFPPKINDQELSLWPHARCLKGEGGDDIVLIELNGL